MRSEVNRERLATRLSVPRNRALYDRLRETYSTLPIIAHGWDHIHRCLINAITIGETEDCCIDVVFAAALLHDVGFIGNPDPAGHHERGAAACASWLEGWSESERSAIAGCIYSHKGEAKGFRTTPTTIEQKVVCDADLLEKVGYAGMFQSVKTFVEFGATCWTEFDSLETILRHLMRADELAFYTRRGRELAEERGGIALSKAVYARALADLAPYYVARETVRQRLNDLPAEEATAGEKLR